MELKKQVVIEVLKQEIDWCNKNPIIKITKNEKKGIEPILRQSFSDGFTAGLQQAVRLIKKLK